MRRLRKLLFSGVALVVFATALIGAARDPDVYFLIKKNFTIFSEVYREVSLNYVDEVNPQKLMRKGINSMLNTLDPYTVFIDESENQNVEIITRGSYGGVGLDVGVKGGQIVVIAPLEGYAAFKKGIRPGDIIKAVDNISTDELSPEQVQGMTTGEPGTTVSLSIKRFGMDREMNFDLERQRVEINNIAYKGLIGANKDVGYILLNRFGQSAATEVSEAIAGLQAQQKISGFILDLRNNPGGLLQEAVGIVDKFIDPGMLVVETRGRLSEHNNTFGTQEPAMVADLPLVVLQNGGSASASEIVAGALQDYDRAVIMGEQSFGKGLVQIIKPLSYNTALKLTTARYYIPSGRSIQSVTYTHDKNNAGISRPDSLKKAFTTQNGRTVYDGQGIAPDIAYIVPPPSLLEIALRQQGHFFQFANQYAAGHKTFSDEQDTVKLLGEFHTYLDEQNFSYETQNQKNLDQLASRLSKQNIDAQIEALGKAIEREKLQNFKDESQRLKNILYLELVARYRGPEQQAEASITIDSVIGEALHILQTPDQYNQILGN